MSQHINPIPLQTDVKALNDRIENVTHISGSAEYLTSYDIYYTKLGKVCTFVCKFIPNTDISSSIGTINGIELPKPKNDFIAIYPVVENNVGWVTASVQGRYGSFRGSSALTSAQLRATGAYTRGTEYVFAGSYITES